MAETKYSSAYHITKHTVNKVYTGAANIIATFVGTGDGGNQGQCIVYIYHQNLK